MRGKALCNYSTPSCPDGFLAVHSAIRFFSNSSVVTFFQIPFCRLLSGFTSVLPSCSTCAGSIEILYLM